MITFVDISKSNNINSTQVAFLEQRVLFLLLKDEIVKIFFSPLDLKLFFAINFFQVQ